MGDELHGYEWDDTLMVHGWPECGPGRITFEQLYQAFKARYERDLASQTAAPAGEVRS